MILRLFLFSANRVQLRFFVPPLLEKEIKW